MKKSIYVFGTIIYIEFTHKKENEIMNTIVSKLNLLDDEMSIYKFDSVISKINDLAGKEYVKVSDDFLNIVEKSIYYSNLTNGILDVTCKPLTEVVKSGIDDPLIIKEKLKLINYKNILINKDKKEIMLKEANMGIDLGSMVKGYATDLINDILDENNIKDAIIDLGGNVLVKGKNNNNLWNVGIQDPLEDMFNSALFITASDESIVTSGNYERANHIISPKVGLIENNRVLSVSIIADRSIDAEALSTPCFIMGVEEGMKFITKKFNNIDCIYITEDRKIYATEGIKGKICILNSLYKII